MSTISSHYEGHTANSYESAYFYSPGEYTNWLRDLVQNALRGNVICDSERSEQGGGGGAAESGLPSQWGRRRLIDIGGGTGNFTRMLLSGEDNNNLEAVVVDPFLDGAAQNDKGSLMFVKAAAEDFSLNVSSSDKGDEIPWWRKDYHQVLLKEVVHHFSTGDRLDIFRGMRRGLLTKEGETSDSSNLRVDGTHHDDDDIFPPSILIVTRPQLEIDYPLWPAARQVWAANQPSALEIEKDLIAAGFTNVRTILHRYPCQILLDRWLDMVKGRFWSTFSNFTDAELEEACGLIRKQVVVDDKGVVTFDDRLVFIVAS